MKAVIQRVLGASVSVEGEQISRIGPGWVVLLGVEKEDDSKDVSFISGKIANLRIFEDEQGKMNRSVLDMGREVLVVSQFTLLGNCRKGRRPGFDRAAAPQEADKLYRQVVEQLKETGLETACGKFGAHMVLSLENDGPVTLIADSRSSNDAVTKKL